MAPTTQSSLLIDIVLLSGEQEEVSLKMDSPWQWESVSTNMASLPLSKFLTLAPPWK